MSPSPDPLDPLLERWRQAVPPPAEPLGPEVWRRIAAAETPPPRTGLAAALHAAFARPSFAFAFVAACTLLGLFLAEVRLSRHQSERNVRLVQSYLQLIDPLLAPATPGTTAQPAPSP
ncbi:MAG: hypothetical protein HZA31_08170 [Opitutae bacterium]|nr:hypothetical protein [Opitutae bacterium]